MLRFIFGAPGAGKTAFAVKEIARGRAGSGALILIVPEQNTMLAERALVDECGGAVMSAQALSFLRLAYHVSARTGGNGREPLGDAGKNMLLRKAVRDTEDSLKFFRKASSTPGFIGALAEQATEFAQYRFSPDEADPERLDKTLARKLSDLAVITRRYAELSRGYIAADDALTELAERIPRADFLRGARIWIDGFYGFTPQELLVAEALLGVAGMVSVTLPLNSRPSSLAYSPGDENARVTRAYAGLLEAAGRAGASVAEPAELPPGARFAGKPDLAFVSANISEADRAKVYPGQSDSVRLFSAASRADECAFAADEAVRLTRAGYRWRDIGLTVCDAEVYRDALETAFSRRGVPIFIDDRRGVLAHPLIELVRAAVDAAIDGRSLTSVLRMLKTGLTGVSREDADSLENYALAAGARGGMWDRPFTRGFGGSYESFDAERVNAARERVSVVTKGIVSALKPGTDRTGLQYARVIYGWLVDTDVPERLEHLGEVVRRGGSQRRLKEHEQAWGKLMGLLDKLAEFLGGEPFGTEDLAEILDDGLAGTDTAVIPPGLDAVTAGDLSRSRLPAVKALFILGADSERFPPSGGASGLLTSLERERIEIVCGKRLAPTPYEESVSGGLTVRAAVSAPSERLYISYAAADLKGREYQPSRATRRIAAMLGGLAIEKIERPVPAPLPRAADPDRFKLRRETADILYGRALVSSVSRLEQYARCPFGYFARYNLRAKPRRRHEIAAVDVGSLLHDSLSVFYERVRGIDWRSAGEAELSRIASEAVDESLAREGREVFASSARYRDAARRARRMAEVSVAAVIEHLRAGAFEPEFSEAGFGGEDCVFPAMEFEIGGGRFMRVVGRIDRADIAVIGGREYVKVIDYKSGGAAFSYPAVYFGLSLQLLVYLGALRDALSSAGREVQPAAALYFRLADPIVDYADIGKGEQPEGALARKFRMSGVVDSDPDVIAALDGDFDKKSRVVPVEINKDGAISARSAALPGEDMRALIGFARQKTAEAGGAILSGGIAKRPRRDGASTACARCDYAEMCEPDEREWNDTPKIGAKEALERILER
ncbi:MAG: PD-(D/E)XK nuclease family protein [Clostridiales bacterium]|jgi:ATP-dependent helicase/nuclease subunit B|nr:PD-(D/E)XK nuclease family protein [Clostridiales bacterium]